MNGFVTEWRVAAAWQRIRRDVVRVGPEPTAESLAPAWTACEARVRALFAGHYGPAVVERRFQVPADYALFMTRYGGGWRWPGVPEQDLFSVAGVVAVTTRDFEAYVTNRQEEDAPQDDGLWLSIAHYSDKHDILLCCDRGHRFRGQVVDFHDSHPWLNGADVGSMVLGRSFLAWLVALGKRA